MQPSHLHLQWPFFDDEHRSLGPRALDWASRRLATHEHPTARAQVDATCRSLVRDLGSAGLTRYCVRAADGGVLADFDARAICLLRETLAWWDGLADFAFAM